MNDAIFITRNGEQFGPYTRGEIATHLQTGTLTHEDLAWWDGRAGWEPLRSLLGTEPFASNDPDNQSPPASELGEIDELWKGVPFYRKFPIWISALLVGFVLFAPLLWAAVIIIFTGTVFTKKLKDGGRLAGLSAKWRIAAVAIIGVQLLLFVGSTAFKLISPSYADSGRTKTADAIYNKTGEDAIREAEKFMIGTWSYTETRPGKPSLWFRWVIKSDGTALSYRARAIEDDWGEPSEGTWKIESRKYTDTGERYFQFVPDYNFFTGPEAMGRKTVIINRDGTLEYRAFSDLTVTLTRGDSFPFSK